MHGEDTSDQHSLSEPDKTDSPAAESDKAAEPDKEALEQESLEDETETPEPVSGYDDVSALFERLAATEPGSVAHAVDRFDLSRGSNFLSFAVPTIMGEVRRYFRDNTWAMRVPRRVKETHLRIGAAVDQLSQRLGRSPTAKEIAAELDVDPDEVTQAVIAGNAYQPTSIDAASIGRDSDASLLDTLGEEESQFDRVEEYIAVRPLLAGLPERERRILTMRFFESMTQTQIASQLGISQMHVSRILAKTLARLRELSERD